MPADYQLGELRFDTTYRSCWEVRWWRVAAGIYSPDRSDPTWQESVVVLFHETLGLLTFGFNTDSPAPKTLEVKVSRQEAILKAARAVPLVQRTPLYRSARVSGFVVKSLKEASLQVFAPNWLLNPDRTDWQRDERPTETRLCWVVRFTTVNSNPEPAGGPKLVPPELTVYVDAASGEIVGANST